MVRKGRSDVNCLLADCCVCVCVFLSPGRHTLFSWAVSVRLTVIAYQIYRFGLVVWACRGQRKHRGGHEGGERDVEESRTGYCPPSEQHVSTASALPDCQMKWATTFLITPALTCTCLTCPSAPSPVRSCYLHICGIWIFCINEQNKVKNHRNVSYSGVESPKWF